MRSPLRARNLQPRFLPAALVAALALAPAAPTRIAIASGALAIAFGVALRTWAAGHLEKRERLACTGPYAHHRHPLYAGTLAVSLGFAAMIGGPVAAVALVATSAWFAASYFPRKERSESASLEAIFGGAYTTYRACVPALVPARAAFVPPIEVARDVDLSTGWAARRYLANDEHGTLLGIAAGVAIVAWRAHAVLATS